MAEQTQTKAAAKTSLVDMYVVRRCRIRNSETGEDGPYLPKGTIQKVNPDHAENLIENDVLRMPKKSDKAAAEQFSEDNLRIKRLGA